jgi:hypothetical protein
MLPAGVLTLTLLLAACSPVVREDRVVESAPGHSPRERGRIEPLPFLPSAERRGIGVSRRFVGDPSKLGIKWYPSLAVTEKAVLSPRFSFQEVMETLACPAPRPCSTGTADERRNEALALFQQWWSTQNGAPHATKCDEPRLFGFPYCPREEQIQATQDPFKDYPQGSGYIPIGLFNRIDLAPENGADCGEYRIVFARRSGQDNLNRRLLINFEAVLPNPQPARGLAGCKPVAEFWRGLTTKATAADRADALHKFYFGLGEVPGFGPVIHADNYSAANGTVGGQVRTNQFMKGPWVLRQFALVRPCPACRPQFIPARLPQTPFGRLFGDASASAAHPLARPFQDWLITQLGELTEGDLHTFTYWLPAMFATGQSVSCTPSTTTACGQQPVEGNYPKLIHDSFWGRIGKAMAKIPPHMSADRVVARVTALSCAGCHQLSNSTDIGSGSTWPSSSSGGFVHVSERNPVNGAYGLSELLTGTCRHDGKCGDDPNALLTHRASRLAAVLNLPDDEPGRGRR